MTARLLVARPAPAHVWECTDLPLWTRVTLYALDHHGQPLAPGQLRTELDPTAHPSTISKAISRGVAAGLLAHDSTARCLYSRVGK
jgi:hypothetical protein